MEMSIAMAQALDATDGVQGLGLTVLYDDDCPLCRRLRDWLELQPVVADLELVPASSLAARTRFPDLDHARTRRILTVVGDDGSVWEGERAMLVCGWALADWQPVAERLASSRTGRWAIRVGARYLDRRRHWALRKVRGPNLPLRDGGEGCDGCSTFLASPRCQAR